MNPWVLSCLSHFCRQIWSFPRPKHQDLFKFWLDFKMETYLPGRLLGGCLEPKCFLWDISKKKSPSPSWKDQRCGAKAITPNKSWVIRWDVYTLIQKKTIYDICNIFFMYVKTRYLQISLSPTIGTVPQLFDSCQVRHIHHGLTSFFVKPRQFEWFVFV